MKLISFTILLAAAAMLTLACGRSTSHNSESPKVREIKPTEARLLVEAAYSQFIDVRTPEEYAVERATRTINLPLDTLASNLDRIEKNEPVYIICRTDNRSKQAAKVLLDAGFKQPVVVTGGTEAWKAAGLPMEPVKK